MLKYRHVAIVILIALLGACSSTPKQTTTPATTEPAGMGALSTIEQLIANQRYIEAEDALKKIDIYSITELDKVHFYWLSANLAILLGRGDDAIFALNAVDPGAFNQLSIDPNRPSYLRASALHLKGEFIASARERMFLAGVLTSDQYDTNHQAIWNSLLQAEDSALEALIQKNSTKIFKGWLQLALIMKRNQLDLDKQLSSLRLWQVQFKDHPAAKKLPGGLDKLEEFVDEKAKFIALMIPLSGKLAATGKAVRDGLMAAYYSAKQAGAQVPEIRIYDTAKSRDFWSLYKQAILDGNELVIGPLKKSSVQRLQKETHLPVPTLALNYGNRDATENPERLYQYGLAVEDEAQLATSYARQQGYQSAIALMPKGPWGERVFERFSQSWQEQGGKLIEAQFFSGAADYNRVISRLFAIDESEARARNLRKQLDLKLESQPRRRQDVDFIFVAALPKQARQIKPTLAFNFAKDIPMIATSQIYSGMPSRSKDRDLNDVVFCDIPWILESSPLRKQVQTLWPRAKGSLDRLYALGVDAYQLYPRLGQIKVLKYSSIQGQTGRLSMDEHGQIIRSLPFATFVNGIAKKTQGYVQNVENAQGI
ncbi:penicillin-binding protein activator [Oceaniserpentilla sp. 4NH20-0058]|uniref:penicillin-binding protein activator n=1 Tax=Oceaniserpentilla sp. 4NH20-0058 TaxID=3127660 RepID=UPI003104E183